MRRGSRRDPKTQQGPEFEEKSDATKRDQLWNMIDRMKGRIEVATPDEAEKVIKEILPEKGARKINSVKKLDAIHRALYEKAIEAESKKEVQKEAPPPAERTSPRQSWAIPRKQELAQNYGTEVTVSLVGYAKHMNSTSGPIGVLANPNSSRLNQNPDGNLVLTQSRQLETGAQLVAKAVTDDTGKYQTVEVKLSDNRGLSNESMQEATAILKDIVGPINDVKIGFAQGNSEQANEVIAQAVGPESLVQKEITTITMEIQDAPPGYAEAVIDAVRDSKDSNTKGGPISANGYELTSKDGYSFEITYNNDTATIKVNSINGNEEKAMEAGAKLLANLDSKTADTNKTVTVTGGDHKEAMESKLDNHGVLGQINNSKLEY